MTRHSAVRERISPRITASLFANYRSSADAVLELVDNALDSRLPDQQMRIEVTVQRSALIVYCAGGAGMGPKEFSRHYLYWGASPKRGRGQIGRYGQGGKAAIGFLGTRFSIEASRPGEASAWRISDSDYRTRDQLKTYPVDALARRAGVDGGYVRLRVDGVDKRIDERRLGGRLLDTYRPLLELGAVSISLNGRALEPAAFDVVERREFRVRAAGATVTGWYGVRAEPGADAGMRCYRLGRLITAGEFFGHPQPAQVPGLGRLLGEVEVPIVQLTMNKSDFDRDSAAWIAVEARMHRLLAPLARRLARGEPERPPASALRAAEQARRLLSQALRLMESAELFPGFEAGRGGRAPGAQEAGADELPLEVPAEPTAALTMPRPPESQAGATGRRRRGFGEIVVKPLDPAIRSQTVIEDGVRKIVINSKHPLFVERKGDTMYQLATAAREICFVSEPADARDFDRRVNEIVLAAFQLRARRTRRRPAGRQLPLLP